MISDILSIRKKRLSLQREADLLEQQEKTLMQEVVNSMNRDGLTFLKEGDDEVQLTTTEEPVVDEWPQVLDYIVSNNAVDLLQKRLTTSAVKARWSDGVTIPGVRKAAKQTLKFNV